MLADHRITREAFAKLDPSAPGGFRSIVDALTDNQQLPPNFQFELVSGTKRLGLHGDVQQQVIAMLLANGYRWTSWSSDDFGESVVRYLQGAW
eukprot:Skav232117  [mRNA]  locus=scaffold2353:145429:153816:+ [translate_table: standard]